jgi:uncharacterized membrane protein (DUF2068 family)
MDWSLYRCGRAGHITYAPDEPALRDHVRAQVPTGELWQCLRCASYVTGAPQNSGPALAAPVVRRGKELRSEFILRVFAVERVIRFLLFGAAAYAIWQFRQSRQSIEQAFEHELPIVRTSFRELGYNVDRSSVLGLFRHALRLSPTTLTLLAAGLAAYALIELIEATGLWLAKRWGEYFAMVVTSLFLPYEIYDISAKFTWIRVGLFLVNLALVVYLVVTKRLFGVRGGKEAYDALLRSESVLDEAAKMIAVPALPPSSSGITPAVSGTELGGASAAPATVRFDRGMPGPADVPHSAADSPSTFPTSSS